MASTFESFHIAGLPAGGIIREMSDRALTTTTCFRLPGGALVHTESRIEFHLDVFGWTEFSYQEFGTGLRVQVARDDLVDPECVPSYVESTLIRAMLRAGESRLLFTIIDEGDPHALPAAAELSITSQDGTVDKSGTVLPTTGHIEMKMGGKLRNRHWLSGTTLVASDWNGARSFPEETLAASLVGLNGEVEAILRGK